MINALIHVTKIISVLHLTKYPVIRQILTFCHMWLKRVILTAREGERIFHTSVQDDICIDVGFKNKV